MKKFRTYGKNKFKTDMRTNDWDDIKREDSSPKFKMNNRGCEYGNKVLVESSPASDVSQKLGKLAFDTGLEPKVLVESSPASDVSRKLEKLTFDTHLEPKVLVDSSPVSNDVSLMLEKLTLDNHSTPIASSKKELMLNEADMVVSPFDPNYSFRCRRSVSFVASPNSSSFRKKNLRILSTPTESPSQSLCQKTMQRKLLDVCEQQSMIALEDYACSYQFTKKIGEGSYGEVYEMISDFNTLLAVKIVPVGNKETLVNGYSQMSLDEIVPEMVISKKLSSLGDDENQIANHTRGFIQLNRLRFCVGKYPQNLLSLWEEWDEINDSENDHPEIFTDEQLYVVFETTYGGVDLEKTPVKNLKAATSILHQLVAALASAETMFQFEHRDLHHGNVLINTTKQTQMKAIVNGKTYHIETNNIHVSIIDFTMARLISDDCVVFTDLENEEVLFQGKGDIQFDVYRDMKAHNGNNWESYNPYSNVLWVKYITEKLIQKLKSTATLKKLLARISSYETARDILQHDPLFRK